MILSYREDWFSLHAAKISLFATCLPCFLSSPYPEKSLALSYPIR